VAGIFANDATEKEVSLTLTRGRYVRLVALSEVNGMPFTSVAELNVLGTAVGNQAPNGVINSPSSNLTISVGDPVNFTGTGIDPDNNVPLKYHWDFGSGSGISDSTEQNPGVVQFNNPGIFTVTFTVTDDNDLADPVPATRVITAIAGSIPQTNWSLTFVDSSQGSYPGVNAFDGNTGTMWHTQYSGGSPPPPHEIQIDLGGEYDINGFRYLPRQDGSANGRIRQYEFYISTDGTDWGSPAATGIFANNATEKQVSFTLIRGRYVRLRALSEVNGKPWTSVAELNVLGQCVAPSVKIIEPRNKSLQTSTNLHVFANACLNSVTHNGWGVRFVLDGGPLNGGDQLDIYSSPFEIIFTNLNKSEHVVDAFIIDGEGNWVSGSRTHDDVSQVGIGDYYVAMGDSITAGQGDDISTDNTSLDGRNTGGGYEPLLNNLLTNARGYPHTVINEGVGGSRSIDGVSLIQTLLSRHPDAQYFLIQYGTNDAGAPVPSGLGLHLGDPGYPGTFKDNMQRIITSVKNAGKLPYLAKVPFSKGQYLFRNLSYQGYNQVIDELVAENNIGVVPPDFYGYFQNHQNEFFDDLHPNGIGYQSMGNLWFNALP
jgi:lysophospholipase L1-like esterase